MHNQEIPVAKLNIQASEIAEHCSERILENEIEGITVEHHVVPSSGAVVDHATEGVKTIYLFIQGAGSIVAADASYEIVPETIFLPNMVEQIVINVAQNDTLHYLKISTKLTAQDKLDLAGFPAQNTQNVYYAKFIDCQPYTEKIKNLNTVSRTILSNKIIPRVAMGTVQTKGPDEVGAHEHPMLEQLFLGLSENSCTVYADDAQVDFPEHALLHIPLGSRHSVSVEKDEVMYYVWMDFFLDKQGEEWLNTHKVIGGDE